MVWKGGPHIHYWWDCKPVQPFLLGCSEPLGPIVSKLCPGGAGAHEAKPMPYLVSAQTSYKMWYKTKEEFMSYTKKYFLNNNAEVWDHALMAHLLKQSLTIASPPQVSFLYTDWKTTKRSWRDGSAVTSICCSCRGFDFGPQNPYYGSQAHAILV